MDIDLRSKGEEMIRYESDICPSVGSTINCLRLNKNWKVLAVNHLVKQRMDIPLEPYHLNLITVEVEEI